jgi:hypothetical protein
MYRGSVDVTAPSSTLEVETTDPNGNPAALEYVTVSLNLPPILSSLLFSGPYPGSQTELKENDTFILNGSADKDFDLVEVADYGAGKYQQIPVVVGTSFSVPISIANRGDVSTLRPARARVRDAATGAFSDYVDTNVGGSVEGINLVRCSNLHPLLFVSEATYPASQQALKGSEQATVVNIASYYDSILYDSPNAQLDISNPFIYEGLKTVTRLGGSYNVSVANFRVSAYRNANGASTSTLYIVRIADAPAVVSVVEPASRLRSGGNDGTTPQDHSISLVSSQNLIEAPTLYPDSGGARGVFVGSWSGGPSTWSRLLRVQDTDEKGVFSWSGLVATNLAGIVTNVISGSTTYELGGFVGRTVVWDPFQTISRGLSVKVQDFSKVTAGIWSATNQPSVSWAIGTVPPKQDGYTIQSSGVSPTVVIWLDTNAASSNTGEAYLYSFEEVA